MNDGSIAIVGASCRFPGAPDLAAFWDLLTTARDAVTEVDAQRWSTRFFYHPSHGEPARSYTWAAGLIDGVDQFEPAFFGISPREAAQMDPQQRILLELVWHAAEDAGIPVGRLAGNEIGVYVGASSTDYRDLRLGDPASGDSYFMTGGTLSILANRISHVFDLRGPSLAVDTACSSSIVALHHACEALRNGRIAGAVVGGINLLLAPYPFLGFCRAAMLSHRGRCFAFDARADGYVRGEGGGAVILKPLRDALRDGDRIRAVIRGTGVNSDGHTIGLSLPSEAAQAELIRSVCTAAGVGPDDLAFFEMHGTGTPAGDPIEAAAVGRALGQARRVALPIGSVKTNIGHLEPASGIAGLIKAALALEHGIVPPTLNCETPNPDIPFDALNLRLLQSAEPIESGSCAGVNSFGFGGTNAHAILAPPPRLAPPAAPDREALPPLLLSARTAASLRELAQRWEAALTEAPMERVPAMLRAAARRRDQHAERLVAWAGDRGEIAAALADFAGGTDHPAVVAGTAVRDAKLAFVFSGNGSQWPGMGRSAYASSPAFRDALAEVDEALRLPLGWSVAEAVADGVDADRLVRADVAQPLLFATQVGIVSVLRGLGIVASGHIGHSVGEIGAAWSSGALSLAEAANVVAARSRQQERTRGVGRMAALALGEAAAAELLAEVDSRLEIGAINATQSVTVSGPTEAIDRLASEARRRGVACRGLDLDFAFHSAAMDPIRDDLLRELVGLTSAAPDASLISTVTGRPVGAGDLDDRYWWQNIRHPVRFADGTAALIDDGYRIFLEIGPHPVLQAYLHDGLRAAQQQGRVLATLARKQTDSDPFAAIAARCHVAGCDIAGGDRLDGPADPSRLPLYPWQKERFWFDRTVEDIQAVDPRLDHPLLGFRQPGPVASWLNHLDPKLVPWLADHAVEGAPVLPAAAVVEMALAAARLRRPDAGAVEVADVELRRPLPFDQGRAREIRCVLTGEDGDWELRSRPRLADEPLTLHAVARLVSAADRQPPPPLDEAAAVIGQIDAATLYGIAARLGLDYGASFRTVRRVDLLQDGSALAYLDPSIASPGDDHLIHPALLDGALQGLLGLIAGRNGELADVTFLPWRFGRVRLDAPFGRAVCRAKLRLTRLGARSASAEIGLFDAAGLLVGELSDCWFRRIELARRLRPEDGAIRADLVPAPLAEPPPPEALDNVGEIIARLIRTAPDVAAENAERALLLDALVASVALAAMPPAIERDAPFTVSQVIDAGAIAPAALPLFCSLLQVLERFGAANATGPVWQLAAENDLPDVADVWRSLLAEAPELVAELALIAAATTELPGYLLNGAPQSEAAPSPMIEHLLYGSPAGAAVIDMLCEALGEIASHWPRGRPLRVLEIGALGGLTRRLLDRLAQASVASTYVASHPDPEQVARLSLATAGIAGARACCWPPREPENDPDIGRFDIIVSAYADTRSIDATLPHLSERLAPGGLFLAAEPAPNPLWHLVFGRDAGWWPVAGDDSVASPLRSCAEWQGVFADSGLEASGGVEVTAGAWPCSLIWGRLGAELAQPASVAVDATARCIHLIAPNDGDVAMLADRLATAGHAVRAVDPATFAAAGRGAGEEADPNDNNLALWAIEADGASDQPAGGTARLVALAARLATAAAHRQMPLWLVTTGAQQIEDGGTAGLIGAALWGIGRVLSNEVPRLQLRLIDLPPTLTAAARGAALAAELTTTDRETEVVWTTAGRHVLRLRRGLPVRWAAPGETLALTSAPLSGSDVPVWEAVAPRGPGKGEVVVDVHAAGLNFRDVMWAMGLVPEEALIDGFTGPTFGLECAGVVRAVGPGVTELAPGDRVTGFAPASFATRVTTAIHAMTRIPHAMSFAAAATLPVTFVTAAYALGTLARLAPGEIVLIHAASGGVGLAAIQYAKRRGAVVIATAGSETKRAFLRLAGADHVLNSRDLAFADAVRAITGGGVDVVLNSLSGEAMEQSLSVLKPFGRFLELGKRDFYLNRRIHLRPLRQNISYFAIDVDQLPAQRPDVAQVLLAEIGEALENGSIRPLAHRIFGYAAAGDAFRVMQASAHIGKLVLVPNGNIGVRLPQPRDLALRRDGTYLVTGGIAGFGFAAAQWLAQHGAGAIALLGRRGIETPGAADRVAELQALGAEARVYAGDVANPMSLEAALADIRSTQPPLRGVVHAASVIADGLAAELDETAIAAALRPKLDGAILLDRLTRGDPLELFVLFSSATTLLGAPGQGAYVAANAALEALARQRRAGGRPALAIAWGPIEDVGYLAERSTQREALARRLGAKTMTASQALAALPAMVGGGLSSVVYAETSWSEAQRHLPILAAPLFGELCAVAGAASSDDSLIERLAGLGADEAMALLKSAVAEEAASILRMPAGALDPLRPLSEFGMDSLMAVELRLALENRLRVDLPLMSLAEGTSVASIATRLASAVLKPHHASEIVNLAERYEVADAARLGAVTNAVERFEALSVDSAAAG